MRADNWKNHCKSPVNKNKQSGKADRYGNFSNGWEISIAQ
jgi:hypothetical protein